MRPTFSRHLISVVLDSQPRAGWDPTLDVNRTATTVNQVGFASTTQAMQHKPLRIQDVGTAAHGTYQFAYVVRLVPPASSRPVAVTRARALARCPSALTGLPERG